MKRTDKKLFSLTQFPIGFYYWGESFFARFAVERDFAGRAEERETDFFDVTVWRGTAEFVSKYFTKGRMIALDGRLQAQT